MKIVFGGAFALIALGVVLFFAGASTPWVVFCVALGVGLVLIGIGNPITLGIGMALLVIAVIAFVIALIGNDRQLLRL